MVPGALLLDAVLQAISQAQAGAPGPDAGTQRVWHIASAKFLSPVQPGETLALSWLPGATGSSRFTIACGLRQIASGTVLAEAKELAS
jgi:3-hydroxymyristoyl/3-hydroxydecanoyl-(acyl carrier protein) dehydratase